jgi:hypothetical protein
VRHHLDEALHILDVTLDALLTGLPARGRAGFDIRRQVGELRATAPASIEAGTIGTDLYACFEQAFASGVTMVQMDAVREDLLAEQPVYDLAASIKSAGIVFSLVEQSRIIAAMEFVSRSDVDAMLNKMVDITEQIKLEVSELLYGTNYETVVALSASLIQHLADTERQLPRIVNYTMVVNLPALNVANLLYGDGARYDELIKENKTIHPAFMQRVLVALSQ